MMENLLYCRSFLHVFDCHKTLRFWKYLLCLVILCNSLGSYFVWGILICIYCKIEEPGAVRSDRQGSIVGCYVPQPCHTYVYIIHIQQCLPDLYLLPFWTAYYLRWNNFWAEGIQVAEASVVIWVKDLILLLFLIQHALNVGYWTCCYLLYYGTFFIRLRGVFCNMTSMSANFLCSA